MHSKLTRSIIAAGAVGALAVGAALVGAAPAHAAGVTGPAFYVDGAAYRTVGTPTDLSSTGAPAHAFQPLYAFPDGTQMNVSTAAPGDPGYRGGRWTVLEVVLPNGYAAAVASGDLDGDGVLDSDEELWAAEAAGDLAVGGVLRTFVCPVIPLPAN